MKFKRLTHKERRLVELKAKGVKHDKAYRQAYDVPETTSPATTIQNTHKILNKPHVKAALQIALQKHNITLDNALAPIGKSLTATKTNEITGAEEQDLTTQLKGSDRALKLLGVNGEQTGNFHLHLHNQRSKYDL
jgi:Tfp pilus assembly PilM family ATPase